MPVRLPGATATTYWPILSVRQLREAITRGDLRPERWGRQIVVSRRIIMEWRESCRDAPSEPRLWEKPAEHHPDGKLRKRSVWVIRDGKLPNVVTGVPVLPELPDRNRGAAEPALADYLTAKHNPARDEDRALGEILVTDVLAVYGEDVAPKHARPDKTAARLLQLGAWWEGKTVAEVNGKSVRAYGAWRKKTAWKSAKLG